MGQCCMKDSEKQEDEEFADIREEETERAPVKTATPKVTTGDNKGQQSAVDARFAKYAAAAHDEEMDVRDEERKDEAEAPPPNSEDLLKKKLQAIDEKGKSQPPSQPASQPAPQSPPQPVDGPQFPPASEPGSPDPPQPEETAQEAPPVTPPPPKKMTLKEREAAEEAERVEIDRKRKEAILAEGGVKKAQTFTWKAEDLEVADDKVEIAMDGEDFILEIEEDEPTPEKDISATPERPPYPSSEWFEAQAVKPPANLSYFHVKDTLTLTFRPAPPSTQITFTPPSVVHYKTPENEAYLDLLHDGCSEPRLLSAVIPCLVAVSEDDLRAQVGDVTGDIAASAGVSDGYSVEVKQLAEMTMQSCTCMVRVVGPVGDLNKVQAIADIHARMKNVFKDGVEYCGIKFNLMEEQTGESVTLRLRKPTTARWSSVIKPPSGDALQAPPAWITPDDVDTDEEEDYT